MYHLKHRFATPNEADRALMALNQGLLLSSHILLGGARLSTHLASRLHIYFTTNGKLQYKPPQQQLVSNLSSDVNTRESRGNEFHPLLHMRLL